MAIQAHITTELIRMAVAITHEAVVMACTIRST